MVTDSIEYLKGRGLEVLFDAEHFFDGYKRNPEFSLRVLEGAAQVGCGPPGALRHERRERCPHEVETHRRASVVDYLGADVAIGVHLHDDTGCGVANALAGVRGGATQVQGTINGYGERTGNCNLTTIIPNLTVKMGVETLPPGRLERLTPVAHHVAELVNMALNPQAAYVGTSAFAHKAGPARERDRQAARRVRAHRAGLRRQRHPLRDVGAGGPVDDRAEGARSSGIELDGPTINEVVDTLKHLEHEGYHFEVADASLELLMRRAVRLGAGLVPGRELPGHHRRPRPRPRRRPAASPPRRRSSCTSARSGSSPPPRATVRSTRSTGRCATRSRAGYPALDRIHLTDYKVRVLDTAARAPAPSPGCCSTRTDGEESWTTIGVSENIIEASWQALSDSLVYGLLRAAIRGVATCRCPPIRTSPSPLDEEPRQQHEPRAGQPHAAVAGRGGRTGPATSARSSRRARCSARPARTSATRSRWRTGRQDRLRLEPGEHGRRCGRGRRGARDEAGRHLRPGADDQSTSTSRWSCSATRATRPRTSGVGARTWCAARRTTTWCGAPSWTR